MAPGVSSATPAGVMATLNSLFLVSVGTPTRMIAPCSWTGAQVSRVADTSRMVASAVMTFDRLRGVAGYDRRMTDRCVTATVQIDARPDLVYGLITDLPTLASLAEEAVAMEWRKGDAVRQGAVFTGHNQHGKRRWSTKCTVTDAEPGRRFAFDVRHSVFPIARWQYDIAAADGGCQVTESTWDRRPGWFRKLAGKATGVTERLAANADHIQLTLQRLKQRAEAG